MDLFDSLEGQGAGRFLNVLINGEESKSIKFKSLFPPEIYSEIILVSYVSSYKFFFENTRGFANATLIIGEEENISKFLSLNVKEIEELPEDLLKEGVETTQLAEGGELLDGTVVKV